MGLEKEDEGKEGRGTLVSRGGDAHIVLLSFSRAADPNSFSQRKVLSGPELWRIYSLEKDFDV